MNVPRQEGGIPHSRRTLAPTLASAAAEENWSGANDAKAEKLRRHTLQRRARTHGLQLRHSSYGYALVDTARKRVEDRDDMSLDEVESWLNR